MLRAAGLTTGTNAGRERLTRGREGRKGEGVEGGGAQEEGCFSEEERKTTTGAWVEHGAGVKGTSGPRSRGSCRTGRRANRIWVRSLHRRREKIVINAQRELCANWWHNVQRGKERGREEEEHREGRFSEEEKEIVIDTHRGSWGTGGARSRRGYPAGQRLRLQTDGITSGEERRGGARKRGIERVVSQKKRKNCDGRPEGAGEQVGPDLGARRVRSRSGGTIRFNGRSKRGQAGSRKKRRG